MTLVVTDQHDAQLIRADIVKDVVGKTFQIRPPEVLVHGWKLQGIFRRFVDHGAQFVVKLVCQTLGNLLVIGENFLHIPLDQRMIDYFHAPRCRLMAFQKSSELIVFVVPESSS